MLNAVWVAVIVAAAFWVVGVCAAVYVMAKAARLMSQTTDAVASLRERQDALIERAAPPSTAPASSWRRTDCDHPPAWTRSPPTWPRTDRADDRAGAAGPGDRGQRRAAACGQVAALAYGVNRALWMRYVVRRAAGSRPPAPRPAAARPSSRREGRSTRPAAPAGGGLPSAASAMRRRHDRLGCSGWCWAPFSGWLSYRRLTALARSVSPAGRAQALGRFAADVRAGHAALCWSDSPATDRLPSKASRGAGTPGIGRGLAPAAELPGRWPRPTGRG